MKPYKPIKIKHEKQYPIIRLTALNQSNFAFPDTLDIELRKDGLFIMAGVDNAGAEFKISYKELFKFFT